VIALLEHAPHVVFRARAEPDGDAVGARERPGFLVVAQGNRFFCNNILDLVVENPDNEEDCEPTNLSPREYEVLEWITKGKTTAQIAEELHLSVHTINSHRKNILRKLNMRSPAELIVYAIESGLVKPA